MGGSRGRSRPAEGTTPDRVIHQKLYCGRKIIGIGHAQETRFAIFDKGLRAADIGTDDSQACRHGFEDYVAKSFSNTRIEKDVGARDRAPKLVTFKVSEEDRVTDFGPHLAFRRPGSDDDWADVQTT